MKANSTLFLKLVILGIFALTFFVAGLILVEILSNVGETNPYTYILYPIVGIMYLSAVPFYIALLQGWKLLTYIDKNTAFSTLSIKALKNIIYCALTIAILYILSLPFLYMLAEMDDAPGVIVIGMIISSAAIVIATFAAVLQKLIQSAIEIKSENDLTV